MCDYEDYSFVVEKAYDKIYKLAYKKAKEIYGESLPYLIAERLEKELLFIKKYNYAGYYLLAYKAVSYIRQSGEYVTNRDYSSVLVAFLLGINTANPLPPHFYCADCHYVYFDNSQIDWFDLSDKICPICGRSLKKDGHTISCEMFMGQNYCVAILNDNYDRGNLGELPLFRDDVFNRLMKQGFARNTALDISEYVSRVHFKQSCNQTDEYIGMMRENGISEYYIKVLRKLDYLFQKSRSVVDAINLYRLAWYKVHYLTEYYCAFLSNIFKSRNTIDYDDKYNYTEIIKECADKNINFLEADKEKSDSQLFLPENRNIRLPLNNKQYFADNCWRCTVISI